MGKQQATECKIRELKLIELKREILKFIIIVGDFNNPFSVTCRTTGQKTSKEIEELNNTVNQ